MKWPERETIEIWYCYIVFGIIMAFCLAKFGDVPFWYAVWAVPFCCIVGNMLMNSLLRATDREIERENTILQTIEVPGLGKLYQYRSRWELVLQPHLKVGKSTVDLVTFNDGQPSAQELEMVRQFEIKLLECLPVVRAEIRSHYADDLEQIDFNDFLVSITKAPEPILEIDFSGSGDMGYTVRLKDWKVVDVYAGD